MDGTNATVKRLIADALEDVRVGLAPLVASRLATALGPRWRERVLKEYQRRHSYQGDASIRDLTGDVGVLLTVVLQEWSILRWHFPGCRHWIDMMRVLRNVWAHASGLELPIGVLAYTAACELASRALLPNRRKVMASRDHLFAAAARVPLPHHAIAQTHLKLRRRRRKPFPHRVPVAILTPRLSTTVVTDTALERDIGSER